MKIAALVMLAALLCLFYFYSNRHEEVFQRKAREEITAAGPVSARPLASDFAFHDETSGQARRLSMLRGRVVHVNFWASWCLPCRDELPFMQSLHKELGETYTPLLINLDGDDGGRNDARQLQRELAPQLMAVYEQTRDLGILFNVEVLPFHLVIDKAGRVAAAFYARLDRDPEKFKELLLQLAAEP